MIKSLQDFLKSEQASGIILITCTVISLTAANLVPAYADLWHFNLGNYSLTHCINDGLMTIFFLLIGLELQREIYTGELSTVRRAMLPAIAALGGMIVPAAIYYSFNTTSADGNTSGIGIPMATDIAFALGVLSLAGKRVPVSLKIFLTALAVIDDLGAILVIAVFYTSSISWLNLGVAFGIWGALLILKYFKIHRAWPYVLGGIVMWYFMIGSGVHATITGVLVAFSIPTGNETSLSSRIERYLHKPVAFIILPLFALANTSIILREGFYRELGNAVSIGVIAGLFIGKPVGIFMFTYAAVKLKLSTLAKEINLRHIFGVGILGGIGFTMSIFISLLAFTSELVIDGAKIAILLASLLSGTIGLLYLRSVIKK